MVVKAVSAGSPERDAGGTTLEIAHCPQEESQSTKPSFIFVSDSQDVQYTFAIERNSSLCHFHIILKKYVAIASGEQSLLHELCIVLLENFRFSSRLHSPSS